MTGRVKYVSCGLFPCLTLQKVRKGFCVDQWIYAISGQSNH